MPLTIGISNEGWAAPVNPRQVWIVLDGPERYEAALPTVDPRQWAAGAGGLIEVRLQVPAAASPGTYDLAVWLPDAAASLRDDSRYAIQLANDGVWDETTGLNRLVTVELDPSAPGTIDPEATDFGPLP